ncbi:DUF2254 domain-containing protein [Halobacillus halophilus]|uniref:DUF2254 domain-containing protein n=1 Tax=Halobacillus halophilus TaxID=1570 RepID=UPI00136DA12C|nr:DUF2254 domain-containing protein [Halobacillus halophilus]MYL30506.1 DUF2254 domain-containing protein [Halobacillus halophilus]
MNNSKRWIDLRDSFLFLPAIYSVISIISVVASILLDEWVVSNWKDALPGFLLTGSSVAQTLYGSLVTSILTMTTISFSTIMVVLTTYTTQFSPRTLQDFMKSRITQHVLGVFSFGFIFSLLQLFLLGKDSGSGLISPFLTVFVSIVCLAFFIIFIHHSSRFIKVNNLIGTIRKSTSDLINRTFSEKNYDSYTDWDQEDIEERKKPEKSVIPTGKSGYIQSVNYSSLIQWAEKNEVLLETAFSMGEYIQKGMPLFYYWGETQKENFKPDEARAFVVIGNERIDIQDIEFSLQKLVEIAVRAISPSLNDPHTATNCINRIGSLLIELADVYEPIRYYPDDNENLRLIAEPVPFSEYLYKCFYQIRIYGHHDVSVMNSVMEVLYKLAVIQKEKVQDDVWRFGRYMIKAVDVENMDELDFERFNHQAQKLADACGTTISLKKHASS